jgi:integrase
VEEPRPLIREISYGTTGLHRAGWDGPACGRPGELRKVTWDRADLMRGVVHVWRSASKSGDTKTYTSDALNWYLSRMTRKVGIGHWHAHEGRHTAVSIMSTNGVPIQEISDTVGHKFTHVTETLYRHT